MHKHTLTFDDLEGNPVTETHYFNLNKLEAGKMVHLEGIEAQMDEVTASEDAQKAFNLFEKIILRTYGEKVSATVFDKNDERTNLFRQSLAFEALIMELLEDAKAGAIFIEKVLPSKLVAEVKKQQALNPDGATVSPIRPVEDTPLPVGDNAPLEEAVITDGLTDEEILAKKPQDLTHPQLQRAFALKTK